MDSCRWSCSTGCRSPGPGRCPPASAGSATGPASSSGARPRISRRSGRWKTPCARPPWSGAGSPPNRVRQQLWRYYPQVLAVEGDLAKAWLLELWQLAPTPAKARRVRKDTIARLLNRHRVRCIDAGEVLRRLREPGRAGNHRGRRRSHPMRRRAARSRAPSTDLGSPTNGPHDQGPGHFHGEPGGQAGDNGAARGGDPGLPSRGRPDRPRHATRRGPRHAHARRGPTSSTATRPTGIWATGSPCSRPKQPARSAGPVWSAPRSACSSRPTVSRRDRATPPRGRRPCRPRPATPGISCARR